ncbi:MAG: hypothetical protein ABSG90_00145 [Dehalococcoidia bacterium]|jgi:hypothetical protein
MGVAVDIGLGIVCLIIAFLMALIGRWLSWIGFRDKDWSAVVLALMILAVTIFAVVSSIGLFTRI